LFSYRIPQQTVYVSEPQIIPEITPVTYQQENTSDRWFIIPGCASKKIKTLSPVNSNSQVKEI
jgi:hypothetical protein